MPSGPVEGVSPSIAGGDAAAATQEAHAPAAPSRPLEVSTAVIALVFSAVLFYLAGRIDLRVDTGGINPRWWPRTLGMAGIATSIGLLLLALLRPPPVRDESEQATRSGQIRFVLAVALAAAHLVLWPILGFVPVTVVLLAVSTAVFGGRGIKALVVYPVLLTAALHLLFATALNVPL